MNLDDVMQELSALGKESTKNTYLRHGAKEPLFGVLTGDLKPLQKKLKGEQSLALELYATGNSDAMYLAALIADGKLMTKKQLESWVKAANWSMLAGFSVPWVTAEHPDAFAIARKWIDSKKEMIATAGWSTVAALATMLPDTLLPMSDLDDLINRCQDTIHTAPNRVRYAMNNFIICIGTYVDPLYAPAIAAAKSIGTVHVDMGKTACKVPDAISYIAKSRKNGKAAPKRKTVRC